MSGRSNQKARTRTALLQSATGLVKEGRPPSMPEAADRALVSIATAYRYFSSAEELWWEASKTIAFEGPIALPVLNASQICREFFGNAGNFGELRRCVEIVGIRDRQKNRDHQSRGAA